MIGLAHTSFIIQSKFDYGKDDNLLNHLKNDFILCVGMRNRAPPAQEITCMFVRAVPS